MIGFTKLCRPLAIVLIVSVALGGESAGQTLTVDGQGRTIAAVSSIAPTSAIEIQIAETEAVRGVCGSTYNRGTRTLRYLPLPEVTQPRRLAEAEVKIPGQPSTKPSSFQIPGNASAPFVMFNISEGPATLVPDPEVKDPTSLDNCWNRIGSRKTARETDVDEVVTKEGEIKAREAAIVVLRGRIESRRADAATLSRQANAVDRIAAILKEIETTRAELRKEEEALLETQGALREAKETVADHDDADAAEFGMSLADFEYLVRSLAKGSLIKVGGLVTGASKAAYYDFATSSTKSALQMTPMGDYPVLRYGDRIFAVIANVQPAHHPFGFHLNSTAQDGAVVNTDPVRPVFDVEAAKGEGVMHAKGVPGGMATNRAYTDVFLAIRGTFAPNQYPEVTITTEKAADDDPKKRTAVTLVEKAKYPQFRALYRYNFNTGVFGSKLRAREYRKVKTVDNNPATDADETTYRVDESQADANVKPIFAFTYYLKPVDIQAPVSYERLIPNPTLGFAFDGPADNIYLGFSHELLRNAQLFWGWHWGPNKELVKRNEVTEDRDATEPVTRDRRERAFGIGLTFNLNVVKKIFQ